MPAREGRVEVLVADLEKVAEEAVEEAKRSSGSKSSDGTVDASPSMLSELTMMWGPLGFEEAALVGEGGEISREMSI